jgi:hypothetical protein
MVNKGTSSQKHRHNGLNIIALQIGIKTVFAIISKCDEALITVPLRYVFDKYAYVGAVSLV